jgi:hypothetical protein
VGQKEKYHRKGDMLLTRSERYGSLYNVAKVLSSAGYPYEIEYKGKTIRCRTLDAMKEALEELEGGKLVRSEAPWTAEEFQKFTGRIHVPQRRLLKHLLDHGTTARIENARLRELMDIPDNQALAGVLSGISKVALMFDIEPRRVYSQITKFKHSKGIQYYQITSSFLQAAHKYNWPSKADLRDEE